MFKVLKINDTTSCSISLYKWQICSVLPTSATRSGLLLLMTKWLILSDFRGRIKKSIFALRSCYILQHSFIINKTPTLILIHMYISFGSDPIKGGMWFITILDPLPHHIQSFSFSVQRIPSYHTHSLRTYRVKSTALHLGFKFSNLPLQIYPPVLSIKNHLLLSNQSSHLYSNHSAISSPRDAPPNPTHISEPHTSQWNLSCLFQHGVWIYLSSNIKLMSTSSFFVYTCILPTTRSVSLWKTDHTVTSSPRSLTWVRITMNICG